MPSGALNLLKWCNTLSYAFLMLRVPSCGSANWCSHHVVGGGRFGVGLSRSVQALNVYIMLANSKDRESYDIALFLFCSLCCW